MKKLILRTIAVLCLILFFGYIYVYENFLYGKLNHTNVVVAAQDISRNTEITEEHLTVIENYPKELVTEDMILDKSQLVGKRAASFIAKHDTITPDKIEPSELRETEEHRFFSIPQQWLESVPGSLRRLDKVDIWVVKANQRQGNQEELVVFPTDEPILTDVVVAYIKSNQNKEVVGSEEPMDRLDADSKPAVLELSMTNDEYRQLVEAYENGYRLVVSY